MKLTLILIIFLPHTTLIQQNRAQSYESVMIEHIERLNHAGTIDELQEVANGFYRVSQVHSDEWLPSYYTALAFANMGYISRGSVTEKDAFFDEAGKHLDSAEKISANNSEIVTLRGYILMGKLSADPANRGQRLSPRIIQLYGKAMQLDTENPRALVLSARMEYGMAQFMGQGTGLVCERVFTGKELLSKETDNALLPSWGEYILNDILDVCK